MSFEKHGKIRKTWEKHRENPQKDQELNITLIEGAPLSQWTPSNVDTSLIQDWLLNSELKSCPARMAQTLMQNMNWASEENTLLLPLSVHQKFANIVIRRHLELATNSANLVSKTQDTLGLNSAKVAQINFLNVQLARFLLHPMLRKCRSNQEIAENGDSMLIEAHSNPLLGPAVLNSKVPCCAYLLATMLDSTEGRVSKKSPINQKKLLIKFTSVNCCTLSYSGY